MRRYSFTAALVVAVALSALLALGSARNRNETFANRKSLRATEVVEYVPHVPKNAKRVSGSCWTSIASALPTAFRCIDNDSGILDPCFKVGNQEVFCPFTPIAVESGIVMELDQPLPEEETRERDLYWTLEFEDGKECRLFTGTASRAKDDICYYFCDSEQELVCGEKLDKSEPAWKGRIVRLGEDSDTILSSELKRIVRVWK